MSTYCLLFVATAVESVHVYRFRWMYFDRPSYLHGRKPSWNVISPRSVRIRTDPHRFVQNRRKYLLHRPARIRSFHRKAYIESRKGLGIITGTDTKGSRISRNSSYRDTAVMGMCRKSEFRCLLHHAQWIIDPCPDARASKPHLWSAVKDRKMFVIERYTKGLMY